MHYHGEESIAERALYDLEAEKNVLGAMLLHPEAVCDVAFLEPEDFFLIRHGTIYRTIVAVHGNTGLSDPISVRDELLRQGLSSDIGWGGLLTELLGNVVTAVGIGHHARIVQERARARRLVATLHEAIQRVQSGDDLGEVMGAATMALQQPDLVEGYRTASWHDIAGAPPQEWIVRGWIPEQSIGFLFGESSTGKSFVAIDMAARMTTARTWFGLPMIDGPVLYLAGEGWKGLGGRLAVWRQHHGGYSGGHPFDIVDGVPPLETAGRAVYVRLIEAFRAKHGVLPAMIWVDTLAYGLTGDENSAEVVGPALRILSDLRRTYGCSVWGIAHPRKPGQGDEHKPITVHDLRGHGSLRGNVDGLISVECGKDGRRKLTAVKVKDGREPDPIAFQLLVLKTGRTLLEGEEETSCVVTEAQAEPVKSTAEIEAEAEARQRALLERAIEVVVAEILKLGSARSKTAVVEALVGRGVRRQTLFAAFDRALASGRIQNTGTAKNPSFIASAPGPISLAAKQIAND